MEPAPLTLPSSTNSLTTQAAETKEELPTLEHGIPEPEVYLPGTPTWVWITLGLASLVLLLLIIWLVRKFWKKSPPPPAPPINYLSRAIASLNQLEASTEDRPLNSISTEISLIVRNYFAATRSEPALYETTEEFQARQINLPKEAADLLTDLGNVKYSRSSTDQEKAVTFIERSRTCLETIHAAQNITT